MESLWKAVKVLGPSPNFPFSLRGERRPASRKEKVSLPVDPHLIELVVFVSSSQQDTADPGPYSTPIEAELSARCKSQRTGLHSLQDFLSCDLARTVRVAGQHFPACSRLREYLLPASPRAPFHPYPHPTTPASREPESVLVAQDKLHPTPHRRLESWKMNWVEETTNSLGNLVPLADPQFPLW